MALVALNSTNATLVSPQSGVRVSITFQNTHATITIYGSRKRNGLPTSTAYDLQILGQQTVTINSMLDGQEAIQDEWQFISASGTPSVNWFETENLRR